MKYLLILLLSACGPIPVSISRTSMEQSQTNSQTASTAADQQSSNASDSKQGTNSMPVIVVCNQLSSSHSSCITPQQPLSKSIKEIQSGSNK